MKRRIGKCIYCGAEGVPLERGHIIPNSLYPASRNGSKIQRITAPECSACNRGWSDDEAHFRTVVAIAGEPNAPVQELWESKIARSFRAIDGRRRVMEIRKLLVPADVEGQERMMIFPGRDERVLRILRKIVRGLSYRYGAESYVSEDRLFADALRWPIPDEMRQTWNYLHCEPDIFRAWVQILNDSEVSAIWLLSFFERREFLVRVSAPGVVLEPPKWGLEVVQE